MRIWIWRTHCALIRSSFIFHFYYIFVSGIHNWLTWNLSWEIIKMPVCYVVGKWRVKLRDGRVRCPAQDHRSRHKGNYRTPSGFIYHSLAHCQTISRVSRRPQKGTLKWMARQWRVIWIPLTAEPSFLPIPIRSTWFDQSERSFSAAIVDMTY